MNIDQAKAEAQALAKALRALGIADIGATQALEAVARMKGYRNWQTAQAADGIGSWNVIQRTVFESYSNTDLLALEPGQDYAACGDNLFVALMNVALSQPLSRVIKTVEHWADEANSLQMQVQRLLEQDAAFDAATLTLPKGLAPTFQKFLNAELTEDAQRWTDVGMRLEHVRRDLFGVAVGLRNLQNDTAADVLVLNSDDGAGGCIPLRIPQGMSIAQARTTAEAVIAKLRDREHDAPDVLFDFSVYELKVRLAQGGLIPMANTYLGPTWD